MKPVKDGGSAFPTSVSADPMGGLNHGLPGMTLRDYFAAQALSAVYGHAERSGWTLRNVVERSYQIADAMLAERERAR